MRLLAPSLSISLFESYNSSRLWHLSMKSQIILQPLEVILLFERLRTCKFCFFLLERAFMTIWVPSSPILLPLMLSSLIVLLKLRQSSRALMPYRPISFFFRTKTSRYFLSLRLWPKATAPSAKIPFMLRASSVMYFLLTRTLLTAFAPPGPIKFYESISSLKVDCD